MGALLAWLALAWPGASAEFRGTDLVSNIAPESQLAGGLADRYPLSAYSLDYHVDVGVTDPGGVPPMIAQWAAAQIWSVTSFLVKTVVDLFTWAFSLDLLNGSQGVLAPIANAIASLYENVIGEAWMVAAILVAGLWGIWKALVQRRYTESAGALAVSVVFMLIALFFVYQPERTIGEASRWTNTLSLAFLSGANRGSLDDPEQAKRQVADHIFETLVYRPWVVLEFGGLRHCVDTDRLDKDGFPRPVGPHDPSRDVCRDHLQPDRAGHGGYADRYLRQPAGSEERKAEYDALRKGEAPPFDRQFAGYRVDKTDSPAVDIQQAGGAYQRLTFAVIVFLGALGAIALLGFLALAVILAQVVALVLLGFAPGRAHHRDLPGRRARVLPQLADQAGHGGVHQGAVLAGDRDRGGRVGGAGCVHRLARVPVRVRAADAVLLGDLPVPQADHRPAGVGHHRRRRGAADAAHDGRATRRAHRRAAVQRARRGQSLTRRGHAAGERARRRHGHARIRHWRRCRKGFSRRGRGSRGHRQRPFAGRASWVERQRPCATRRRWVERQRPRAAPDERRSAAREPVAGTTGG